MKRITRTMLLLIMAVALLAGLAMSVSAAEYATMDEALGYLDTDSYKANVNSDPNFDSNIAQALKTVRESISTYATFWSLLPPIIAIALALITKEVYSSLFIGILSGALIYSNFNIWGMVTNTFDVMVGNLADSGSVGILIFLPSISPAMVRQWMLPCLPFTSVLPNSFSVSRCCSFINNLLPHFIPLKFILNLFFAPACTKRKIQIALQVWNLDA